MNPAPPPLIIPLPRATAAPRRPGVEWVGSLDTTPLAEVLHRIASEERSGDLQINLGSTIKYIYFDHGFVVFSASNLKRDRLGESLIDHTPRDEELDLRVGYAFDIVAEAKMLNQSRISDRVEEQQYEIELRNRKEDDVSITVEKRFYGDWTIVSPPRETSMVAEARGRAPGRRVKRNGRGWPAPTLTGSPRLG